MDDDWGRLLDQALHEPDPLTWRASVWELSWRDRPRAVEHLLELVLNGPSQECLREADALGLIGDRAIVGWLLPTLKADDHELNLAALCALTAINDLILSDVYVLGDFTSRLTFLDLLRSGNGSILEAVRGLFTQVGDATLIPELIWHLGRLDLVDNDRGTDRWAATMIVEILAEIEGEGVIESLISLLASPGSWDREYVAAALGQRKEPDAVEPLAVLLEDESEAVRLSAIEALGLIGDVRAFGPLVGVLRREERWERVVAAEAVGRMRDACTVKPFPASSQPVDIAAEPLIDLLQDKKDYVRLPAIRALIMLGDARALGPLADALNDPSGQIRREAARALATIMERSPVKPDERVIDRLLDALRTDPDDWVRQYAACALGRLGDERVVPALLEALADEAYGRVQTYAARALGAIGDERAFRPLVSLLLGDRRAIGPLEAALRDRDEQVQRAAPCAESDSRTQQRNRAT